MGCACSHVADDRSSDRVRSPPMNNVSSDSDSGSLDLAREQQMRLDNIIAQMIFHEEVQQIQMRALARRNQLGTPPRNDAGLTSSEIENLGGKHLLTSPCGASGEPEDFALSECVMCLGDFAEGETVRSLTCSHKFHASCIDEWLSRKRTCPLCMHDATKPHDVSCATAASPLKPARASEPGDVIEPAH